MFLYRPSQCTDLDALLSSSSSLYETMTHVHVYA